MPDLIITLIIAAFGGLMWLVYQHPKGSRKLILTICIIVYAVGFLWNAFMLGAATEHKRLLKLHPNLEPRPKYLDNNYPLLLLLGVAVSYSILIAFSFYFEGLKKNKEME